MDKYLDVKVGDEFFYMRRIGVSDWNTLYFSETFFLSCKVLRVTKSQFTTESGRYRKDDGYCIGDGYNIYRAGDKIRGYGGRGFVVPDRCQRIEASNYDNEMEELRDARHCDLGRFRITKIKGLERAQKAASLVKQLFTLMDIKE